MPGTPLQPGLRRGGRLRGLRPRSRPSDTNVQLSEFFAGEPFNPFEIEWPQPVRVFYNASRTGQLYNINPGRVGVWYPPGGYHIRPLVRWRVRNINPPGQPIRAGEWNNAVDRGNYPEFFSSSHLGPIWSVEYTVRLYPRDRDVELQSSIWPDFRDAVQGYSFRVGG